MDKWNFKLEDSGLLSIDPCDLPIQIILSLLSAVLKTCEIMHSLCQKAHNFCVVGHQSYLLQKLEFTDTFFNCFSWVLAFLNLKVYKLLDSQSAEIAGHRQSASQQKFMFFRFSSQTGQLVPS